VHARDSLSIVLAPPLLATRTVEPAARCLIDWQATATTAVRRPRPRHLAALGHSPTTFVWSIIPRRGTDGVPPRRARPCLHRLATEKSDLPELVCAPPGPPCRAVLHRGAALTRYHAPPIPLR